MHGLDAERKEARCGEDGSQSVSQSPGGREGVKEGRKEGRKEGSREGRRSVPNSEIAPTTPQPASPLNRPTLSG